MRNSAMRGSGRRRRPAWLTRRRSAVLAVAAAGVLLVGLLQSSGTAQETRVDIGYRCLPTGGEERIVTVTVAGDFPERVPPGSPVQPADLDLLLTVPVAALTPAATQPQGQGAEAADAGAETPQDEDAGSRRAADGEPWTGGTAELAVTVSLGEESAEALWGPLTAGPVTPAGVTDEDPGELELHFRGGPPPVTAADGGDVTFQAGTLVFAVQPPGADVPVTVECVPQDEQPAPLATVEVTEEPAADGPEAGEPDPAGEETPAEDAAEEQSALSVESAAPAAAAQGIEYGTAPPCPEASPAGELDYDRFPQPPPDSQVREIGAQGCTVALGFSNVAKLGGAMILNSPESPHQMNVLVNKELVSASTPDGMYLQIRHLGDLSFPDAHSTFLTFGFQPTTARVAFEKEPVTIYSVQEPGKPPHTTVGYYQHLRLYDVRVNGVPLDVGPACRTARPVDTVLTGSHEEYDVLNGGTLRGSVDIPPFAGCVSNGEDLSQIFTAAISGPGNYIEVNQSELCQRVQECTVPAVPQLPRL